MKALDRAIKRDRLKRYRTLKKLFKARDAASKYVEQDVKISELLTRYREDNIKDYSTATIAKWIVDRKGKVLRPKPPKPPTQFKPSITKLEPNPPKGPEPVIGRRK